MYAGCSCTCRNHGSTPAAPMDSTTRPPRPCLHRLAARSSQPPTRQPLATPRPLPSVRLAPLRSAVRSADDGSTYTYGSTADNHRQKNSVNNNGSEPHENTRHRRAHAPITMRRLEIQLFDDPMAPGAHRSLENRLLPVRHHATMQINGGFHLTPTPLPKVKVPY